MASNQLFRRTVQVFAFCAIAIYMALSASLAMGSGATASLDNGKKLIAEAKCEGCHASKLGGDGSSMYLRKDRRVDNKSKLLSQVGRCNNELNLGLFPDDEAAIAAYLDATHYKFKD
jgi:hypothetical protein